MMNNKRKEKDVKKETSVKCKKLKYFLERKIEGDTNCKDDVKELKKDYVVVREEVVGEVWICGRRSVGVSRRV